MVVLKLEAGDAASRPTSRVGCRVGINIKWCHTIEPIGSGHRRQIHPEPVVQIGAIVRQEPCGLFCRRPPQQAADPNNADDLAASSLVWILELSRYEPAVDKDDPPCGLLQRSQNLIPVPPRLRRGAE